MNIVLTGDSETPIYKQIMNQISTQILTGNLLPGTRLPSIRYLARDLRVSVITTKKAYEELDRQGLIKTVPGKGCFVSATQNEILEEQRLHEVEEKLLQAIEAGERFGIGKEKMREIFNLLLEQEGS